MGETGKKVGTVTHYYSHLNVGTVVIDEPVKVGDQISFKGFTTNFKQTLSDMQFNHQPVQAAEKGQEVGIKVTEKVRESDVMYTT